MAFKDLPRDDTPQLQQLRQQIAALEQAVRDLQGKVQKLEQAQANSTGGTMPQ